MQYALNHDSPPIYSTVWLRFIGRFPVAKDVLSIKLNEKKTDLLMSFGLLNKLTSIIGNENALATVALLPEVRVAVVTACLTKKGKSGALDEGFDVDELDISMEDTLKITQWASEHVIDFFLKATEQTKAIGEQFQSRLQSLMPSSDGSQASAQLTPSAGPST